MKNKTLRNSFGLYIEGLKQSKIIGIPYVCLGVLMMIFDLVNELFNSNTVKTPEAGFMVMLIVSAAATPLMLLMLFNFLNSRKASDFYHAIPRSRSSLYLNFGAAAVTWTVAVVAAMTVIEVLVYAIFGYALDFAMWGQVLLATISSNVLIAGGVMLAISISSTVFSQVIISGLILFLPRILIACFEQVVTDIVPLLPSFEQSVGILGAPGANILIGLFVGALNDELLWKAALYSIVVGVAYAALGLFFFCRRKSESAALPALNRWVQTGIRVIIAFAICLIPTMELAREINKGVPLRYVSDIELMFVFYGVALIAYFVYEAISVRSVRGMWRSWRELLIGLAVLLALNVVFIVGAGLSAKAVLSFQPENDKVVSIAIESDDRYKSYNELRIAETEITEEAIKNFIASQMRKNVDDIDLINESAYYSAEYYNGYNERSVMYTSQQLIRFTMENGREVTRYVCMSEPEAAAFQDMLLRNKDYVDAALDLPDDYQSIFMFSSNPAAAALTNEQLDELYGVYRAEIANVDAGKYIRNEYATIADMTVEGRYKGTAYSSPIDIYLGTPETLMKYIELVKPEDSLADVLELEERATYYDLNVCGYNFYNQGNYYEACGHYYDSYKDYDSVITTVTGSGGEIVYAESIPTYGQGFLASEDNRKLIIDELLANEKVPLDITKPFYIVDITVEFPTEYIGTNENGSYTYDAYEGRTYEFYIQAAEEGSCLELPEFVIG